MLKYKKYFSVLIATGKNYKVKVYLFKDGIDITNLQLSNKSKINYLIIIIAPIDLEEIIRNHLFNNNIVGTLNDSFKLKVKLLHESDVEILMELLAIKAFNISSLAIDIDDTQAYLVKLENIIKFINNNNSLLKEICVSGHYFFLQKQVYLLFISNIEHIYIEKVDINNLEFLDNFFYLLNNVNHKIEKLTLNFKYKLTDSQLVVIDDLFKKYDVCVMVDFIENNTLICREISLSTYENYKIKKLSENCKSSRSFNYRVN